MESLIVVLLIAAAPCAISASICADRNRDWTKGVVLTILMWMVGLGWLTPILLWLGLKKRNPKTLRLY